MADVLAPDEFLSMIPTSKKDKSEVNYSLSNGAERCDNCAHFQRARENSCTKVKGEIEAPYWCELHLSKANA